MSIFDSLFDYIADKVRQRIYQAEPDAAYSDAMMKGDSFSVESEISEALADLMTLSFTMPIEGGARAEWLDKVADSFVRTKINPAIIEAFISGDVLVVPSWNGRNFDNTIVGADRFEIFQSLGDELLSVAYIVDEKQYNSGTKYTLLQLVELEPYTALDGTQSYLNRYRLFIAKNDNVIPFSPDIVQEWAAYEPDWFIPNVDKLLVGRMRSNTFDPAEPNRAKGVPICFGASQPIEEIHYLLDQMHNEFGLSEKAIMADKRLFKKVWGKDSDNPEVVLPNGKERLFEAIGGQGNDMLLKEWAPEIRYQAYMEAIDVQEKMVEKAVGVSQGVISSVSNFNYENVDNVRKSQQKTMSFVNDARMNCESMLVTLAYSWNAIANYYQLAPVGDYSLIFNWSDEYVETFADKQNAILSGESIGATDAVDYRMFLYNEAPEVARARVDEIRAAKQAQTPTFAFAGEA